MTNRRYGWIRPHESLAPCVSVPLTQILPRKADLRDKMPPIFNQGQLNDCTANASVAAFRYANNQAGNHDADFSRLFTYYFARKFDGGALQDEGATIRSAIHSLVLYGACLETVWPDVAFKVNEPPIRQCVSNAAAHRATHVTPVHVSLYGFKEQLANGLPVVFGMTVYESLESDDVAKNGLMPIPQDGDNALGGHAVAAVAYDDDVKELLIRNSWGENWGYKGHIRMPYDAFDKVAPSDAWVVSGVAKQH